MADFPSRQDLFRIARDELLLLNGKLTREIVERDGSDANIIANIAVALAEEVIGQLIGVCAGRFLNSAEDEKLDRLVWDLYSIIRKEASSALGTAVFSTTTANPSAFTIPEGSTVSTPDGIEFLTTLSSSFPAGSIGPIYVPIRSVLAGADQQASKESITSIVSTINGAPSDLTVTNIVATVGADDEESNESLRDRARRFWTSSQRGTIGAIENGALAVPGVRSASAIEVLDAYGRPARWVQLIISDSFTESLALLDTVDPTYDTQSQQLAQKVFLALSDIRAAGNFVQVIVGQVILQSVQLQLTFIAGVDVDVVALQARAQVVNYTNELQPGETWTVANAINALRRVSGLIITENEIVSPAGNVLPKTTQVIRTTLALVTAVAVQSSQPVALTTNPDAFISGGVTSF